MIRNSAMMATRVTLLLLVTGLFAGMWSADSPDDRTPTQKQLARLASSPCAFANSPFRRDARSVTAEVQPVAAKIPLPRGIAAGTYLAVNQFGKTQQVTVASADSQDGRPNENFALVEHYTIHVGQTRWHFVRLETESKLINQAPRQVTAANLH